MRFSTIIINLSEINNLFFTSDSHFHHKNVIEYCNRPFKTVEEMDSTLIKNWNSVVGENDVIFNLGDFCFGSKKSWVYLNENLNGIKYLAAGNHDSNITPDNYVDVQHMFNIRVVEKDGAEQRITVCHYPMVSWYQSHRGAWQLFGHHHGGLSNKGDLTVRSTQLDVGVDVHNYYPISYGEVKSIVEFEPVKKIIKSRL